jgi:hypothetical protein
MARVHLTDAKVRALKLRARRYDVRTRWCRA